MASSLTGNLPRIARWQLAAVGLYLGYLCLLVIGGLAPVRPGDFGWIDSTAFLYIGKQILNGRMPYRDAWDHKPPLIFYLNALGLWLSGGSPWGIWYLALLSLAVALVLCYCLAARVYGRGPALLAATGFCASLTGALEHYNLTEFFALPLQFALFHLFLRRAHALWLGLLTGLLFLLRQNLIGAGLAVALGILLRERRTVRQVVSEWLYMLAGFGIVVALTAGYLYAAGCWPEAWEAFLYNFNYIRVSWEERLDAMTLGTYLFRRTLPLAAAGAISIALSWRRHAPAVRLLCAVCLLDLVWEAGLSSLSGKRYPHYFMTWTPALGLLAGQCGYAIAWLAGRLLARRWRWGALRSGTAFLVLAILVLNVPLWRDARRKPPFLIHSQGPADQALAAYIESQTRPEETIFVWGYAPEIYLLSDRTSASRFFFQKRLTDRLRPPDHATIQTIVQDLRRSQPRLLIDSSAVPWTFIPIDMSGRQPPLDAPFAELVAALEPLFRLVREDYEPVAVSGTSPWKIYRRK